MSFEDNELQLLIERIQGKDGIAFRELYERLVDRVYAYTRSRLGTREDALDCTQQTFIELWKALPRFRYSGVPQFYGFLFTLIKRQIIRKRRERNRSPIPLEDEGALGAEGENLEVRDLLAKALDQLSDLDKDIVVLHHWSRYSLKEIAEMLTLSESNVRVRHHRALKFLKKFLHV